MSYRLRLIITISLLIALTFSVGGTILISASFQTSLGKETDAALESFETVQNTLYLLNSMGGQTEFDSLKNVLSQMAEQNIEQWQSLSLTAGDDVIYANKAAALNGYSLPTPEAGRCSYVRVEDTYGHGLIVLGTINAGEELLTLKVRFDLTSVYEARNTQQRLFFAIYIVVMLFGITTAVVLSFALTRRLHRLTRAVRQISGGDLSTRSDIPSQDEFGQLSRDFDAMADKLQENISRLESNAQRQENFMGAFAHELKTPMTSITGFADLLRQGNLDENTRMMAAEYIYTEAKRLERLSFKLLYLLMLKKDSLTMKRIWLPTYLTEVEKALSPRLQSKAIRLVCRAEQNWTEIEPDLVKSLLYNLIDNAAKAMDDGGIIGVIASAIPGGCQFQVADNGRGMEESELSKITDAFYRVDKARSRSQGGAGLGLALCKQIVQLHHGSIRFSSEPGKGTRVTVTLYGKAGQYNG